MLQTFQKARELGLTVLRMWAFADGPYEWNALQPELELLDDRVLRRALRCAPEWLRVSPMGNGGWQLGLAILDMGSGAVGQHTERWLP